MPKYILTTESESGDNYLYLIDSDRILDSDHHLIKKFLKEKSNDPGYESVEYFEDLNNIDKVRL